MKSSPPVQYAPPLATLCYMSTTVTFTNKPKNTGFEADKVFNERRANLVPHVEQYILTNNRFFDKKVRVTFPERGISSLISVIEADNKKVILKIPLSTDYAEGEAQFLKVWEQVGAKVPHVLEEGVLGGHSYLLMEYIDAPVLMDAYTPAELNEQGILLEMGRTLRKMHLPTAQGYGRVVGDKPEFATFKDWISSPDMEERISYVKANKLLGDEHGSIQETSEVLAAHAEREQSCYCHDDFGAGNIFATHPITVFDPNPRFNNRYIDLGRCVVIHASQNITAQRLIDGYFEDMSCDKKVLRGSILLNTYMKFPYWNKVEKFSQIKNMQEYLLSH